MIAINLKKIRECLNLLQTLELPLKVSTDETIKVGLDLLFVR